MATNNAINLKSSGIVSYDGAGAFSALANPLTVSNGGQGNSSLTSYAVLCGGTISTAAIQSVASVGLSTQILTSNGAGALPTFQTPPGALAYNTAFPTINPASSTTYYVRLLVLSTTESVYFIPKACVLNVLYGCITVGGTLGSSENATLSIVVNGSSSTTVSASVQLTAAENNVSNTNLGIVVAAGDYFSIKLVTPSWATPPTTVRGSFSILGT